jgi:hypothetical protein
MSILQSFYDHEAEVGMMKGQSPSYKEEILLISGFDITLYFHNNSVDGGIPRNQERLNISFTFLM